MEQNNTLPTWKDALRISKELQREYDLPIFAMTFKGSANASRPSFNKEAYLTKGVAQAKWADVDSYVTLKNSYDGGGEAQFYGVETGVNGGKVTRRRVWNEFGALVGGRNSGVQYVGYSLSESFTMNDLHGLLAKFVDGLNAIAGFEAYALTLPDDESECAVISVA